MYSSTFPKVPCYWYWMYSSTFPKVRCYVHCFCSIYSHCLLCFSGWPWCYTVPLNPQFSVCFWVKHWCKVHHSARATEQCLAFVEAPSWSYLWEEKETFLRSHTEATNEKRDRELGNTRVLYLNHCLDALPLGKCAWGKCWCWCISPEHSGKDTAVLLSTGFMKCHVLFTMSRTPLCQWEFCLLWAINTEVTICFFLLLGADKDCLLFFHMQWICSQCLGFNIFSKGRERAASNE